MYKEKMMSIEKIENGYIIEVRAPYKKKEQEDDEKCPCMSNGMSYGEKEVYAKDASDLGKKIEALIPVLDMEFGGESEFEEAFKTVKD
jgi:hypothetical protein